MINVENLQKSYGDFDAVKGVSFNIDRGEFFGFLGPNGAGKTTTMRIISCFIKPTAGNVSVLGMDVYTQPSDIKARLGVVSQGNTLDHDISVIENLVVYAGYYGINSKVAKKRAEELLEFVDLSDRADKKIQSLSGGMMRRLQIARSLVNSPDILVMDEPTTGLDPHSRRVLWEKLIDLREQTNMTMLLTTHYMEEASSLCTKVAIMDLGKIVTIDTPTNLIKTHGGNLEDVYLKLTGRPLDS